MNEDPRDHELDAAYRRASAEQAGSPEAATRARIRAEAAAAAQRRRPAANDSRYWMRAVAGLAVVGVGILVWRQTEHRLPGEQRLAAQALEHERAPAAGADAAAPTPGEVDVAAGAAGLAGTAADGADAVAAKRADADASARMAAPVAPPPAATAAAPVAPLPTALQERTRVAASRGNAAMQAEAMAAPALQSAPAARVLPLLRRHFPTQYQSVDFHRLWLVLDEHGEVLLSGELEAGQQLRDLDEQLGRGLAGRTPGPWQTSSLQNARGQRIELSVADVEVGAPR